jgi:hypothetical protein
MEILLDERQTAEKLQLSVRTLQRLRGAGNGPVYLKIGRLVRYRLEAVNDYLATCARRSTSDAGAPA